MRSDFSYYTGGRRRSLTREQVCGVKMTFQGLSISTKQFGPDQPWFEPAYQCLLASSDRASVRAQKRAVGDTHLILEFFTKQESIYDEAGQPWQVAITPSMEQNLALFRSLVLEVLNDGLIPIVAFDGDNGYQGAINALRQLPILVSLLGDLADSILFVRLWDGVFYGATPQQIYDFGAAFRRLLPNGYLGMEHQAGRIPCGEGFGDWALHGPMSTYDVILSEFDVPPPDDTVWQIAARFLGPAYKRPADQPAGDDPGTPFDLRSGKWYLGEGSPRGPYFPVAFEDWGLYLWVRDQITLQQIAADRAYYRQIGYTYVC